MNFFLLFVIVEYFESYKTSLFRRNFQLKVPCSSSRLKLKNAEDSWYFVHFNESPNFSLLSSHGIDIKPKNMISKHWYSLFLNSKQVQYISNLATLRHISGTEKIIGQNLIQFSESLVIETSSTFNPYLDIQKYKNSQLFVYKLASNLYQIQSHDNEKLAFLLSNNEKVYSISPKNNTLFFNNRAAGYTQFNTKQYRLTGEFNDTIVIDRYLELKGLNGQDQVILVADTYLDPNSTYFYDPKIPLFEKNHYYSDHRKISIIFEEYEYSEPHANEHGTHVSGCAAGSAHIESNWSLFNGVAPKAKIAFYQGGASGVYNSDSVQTIVEKTHPCVSTNSWGRLSFDISSENIWNKNANVMNETLFIFSAGNIDSSVESKLDYYETVSSPGAGKNILTVGALSSIPIEDQDDKIKSIYLMDYMTQQIYKPDVKVWSLKRGNDIKNLGVDFLFKKGSAEMMMTRNMTENFKENDRILVIDGKDDFLKINKDNPPLIVLTTIDFEIDNFESLGFDHLFPVLYLDNEIVKTIYNSFYPSIQVETNYVDANLTDIHRASYSCKGLSGLGLMKPDIVTPGTSYFSARSDPNFTSVHADITIMDGTSMAAPNAAGATSLVSQYFLEKKYRSSNSIKPSSSLLRSILINAADPLDENEVSPNADVGFGSLNLGKYILTSVSAIGNDEKVLIGDHIEIIGDQHIVATVEIKDNSCDFRVTLSYLDEVLNDDSSAALAVDLDLVVISPDEKVYRGNQRVDDTEELYSTNERVIVKKDEVKPGKYEIHVISHIPEIVPSKRSEFSVSIFGSLSDSSIEKVTFEKAQKCIPVVENHGKCNQETTLNECIFTDTEGYTGHSCQNEVFILDQAGKDLFELEPFGIKYVNIIYPFDAVFSNLTVSIASATEFNSKYAYTLNVTGLKHPIKEIDADNIEMNSDVSLTIYNHGQAIEWDPQPCFYGLVYNKSPKKTTFVVNYDVKIGPKTIDPTENPSNLPTKNSSRFTDKEAVIFFISLIVISVVCVILLVIIVVLAVMLLRTKKVFDRSEIVKENLRNPLL